MKGPIPRWAIPAALGVVAVDTIMLLVAPQPHGLARLVVAAGFAALATVFEWDKT